MMNSYDPYKCNLLWEERKAKGMSDAMLIAAIVDCKELISSGINVDKYRDQICIYRLEIARRVEKSRKKKTTVNLKLQ